MQSHLSLPLQVGLLDLNGKDGGLRLRAANMLGLLIRHASSISASLVDAGVLQQEVGLSEGLQTHKFATGSLSQHQPVHELMQVMHELPLQLSGSLNRPIHHH